MEWNRLFIFGIVACSAALFECDDEPADGDGDGDGAASELYRHTIASEQASCLCYYGFYGYDSQASCEADLAVPQTDISCWTTQFLVYEESLGTAYACYDERWQSYLDCMSTTTCDELSVTACEQFFQSIDSECAVPPLEEETAFDQAVVSECGFANPSYRIGF